MLTVPKSEAEILNRNKFPQDWQGNGQFAADSQGRLRTSNGDPRTGTFPQTLVTVSDTACCVKGILTQKTSFKRLLLCEEVATEPDVCSPLVRLAHAS